tara:strand:- start:17574 stop:18056 length:483 start_codon:yes stop_codon:yes gene_type:complete
MTTPAPTKALGKMQGRLQRLAWFLDNSIRLPGGYRIGYDGVIGLIPGVGDFIGAVLSSYIVAQAARMGVSNVVLGRMGLNVLAESAIGAIPFLGDVFDMAFKANARNVALLDAYVTDPQPVKRKSALAIGLTLTVVFSLISLLLAVIAGLAIVAWRFVFG